MTPMGWIPVPRGDNCGTKTVRTLPRVQAVCRSSVLAEVRNEIQLQVNIKLDDELRVGTVLLAPALDLPR